MTAIKSKIQARIAEKGWTFEQLVAMCDYCKKTKELGANERHTGFHLSNIVDGYCRGLHGLKTNNYRPVSDAQIAREDLKWSKAARKVVIDETIREHGTPENQLAKLVYEFYTENQLTEEIMRLTADRLWEAAVITKEEDQRLNDANLRNRMMTTPAARWAAAGIEF